MNFRHLGSRALEKPLTCLHWLLVLGLFGKLTAKAFLEFKLHWDYLAYHLPFALRRFDMTTYTTYPHINDLYHAFPPLPHLMSGCLMFVSGDPRWSSGIGIIAVGTMVAAIKLVHRDVSIVWFLTALLAVPLVNIHISSGYIDFWTGAFCGIMFVGATGLTRSFTWRSALVTIFGALGAMLSKYQAWPFVCLLSVFVGVRLIPMLKEHHNRKSVLAFSIALILAVSIFPVRNILIFGNPTHPFMPPIVRQFIKPTSPPMDVATQRPNRLLDASRPRMFLESALELSRLHGDGFRYSIDQGFEGGPLSPHFRLGGWGVYMVFVWLVLLTYVLWRQPFLRSEGIFLAMFFCSLHVLPQNHELRYWMMVPICFAILCALSLRDMQPRVQLVTKALFSIGVAISLWQSPLAFHHRARQPHEVAPPEAREFWSKADPSLEYRVCGKVENAIFWAGPKFNSFRVQACD
jgi:hypothetical protein